MDPYKEWLGIPEELRPPDHYQLLRLKQFEDDPEKVRKHYKKLNGHVRQYATGQYSNESQELLNELAKAMLCLTDPERKREYDESQGREFEDDSPLGRKPMGKTLVEQGHVTRDQIKEAEGFADARGLSLRDAVVQMKLVPPNTAAQALATELGLPFLDLAEMIPDDSVLDKVPRNVVKRNTILPLFIDDDTLLVACVDLPEPELEEELRLRFGVPMRGVLATPLAINQGIAKYYAPGMRDESASEEAATKKKSKPAKGAKPAKAQKSSAPLSEGEKDQRKTMGWLFIMWATMGSALLDALFLNKIQAIPSLFGYLATFIIPPIVAAWVFLVYRK